MGGFVRAGVLWGVGSPRTGWEPPEERRFELREKQCARIWSNPVLYDFTAMIYWS